MTPFIKEYDWEDSVDGQLFWVIDSASQEITHSISLEAIKESCRLGGTTFKVIERTEIDEGDGVPVGSPNTIQIIKADGTVDESIEIHRQHDDLLHDLKYAQLTSMGSSNMFHRRLV